MIRPRDIRRARRDDRAPLFIVEQRLPSGPTARQLEAAEALRHELDLLSRGAPSDAELWRVMDAVR